MSSTDIPKISFKKLSNNDSSVNNQLSYALESHGFFEIIDHGISKDSLAKSYDLAAKFFNLSHEIKNNYSLRLICALLITLIRIPKILKLKWEQKL